ncbi:hypothetical protein BZ19_2858 [Yersinia pseudotuberculosis str. PA3606]|nr:hypothetical protein BZ19_2858 [Yersinia pseudotuberculosis str. PA3606]
MYRRPEAARQSVKADRRVIPFTVTGAFDVIQNFPLIKNGGGFAKGERLYRLLLTGGLMPCGLCAYSSVKLQEIRAVTAICRGKGFI